MTYDTDQRLTGPFDPIWYLHKYVDVRRTGQDPEEHFINYGQAEARLGAAHLAEQLAQSLWRGFEASSLTGLNWLRIHGSPRAQALSGWELARWHASHGDWEEAYQAIALFHRLSEGSMPPSAGAGPLLLGVQAALKTNRPVCARTWCDLVQGYPGIGADGVLAEVQMLVAEGADDARVRDCLGGLYDTPSLAPVDLFSGAGSRFDRLQAARTPEGGEGQPLVSVVVPVFNAEAELPCCLASLVAQDWQALEILVVDDGSQDGSAAVAQSWAERDPRVRLLRMETNQGAYVARNAGFAAAKGAFVTVLDADDWAHPARIARQAQALIDTPDCVANTSHWVRASPDLEISRWKMGDSWVFRNVSSLMVRSSLRDTLGYWDRVQVNADTEYYHRIITRFGPQALQEVCPGEPLSFGRNLAGSLTNVSARHSRTQLYGVRRDYQDAALYWHARHADAPDDLYMPQVPAKRPFRVPALIGPADLPPPETPRDAIQESPLFDALWYRRRYLDVLRADCDPAVHYLEIGAKEDRDPGPGFSASGYRYLHGLDTSEQSLEHALVNKRTAPPLPVFSGALAREEGQASVLVFGAAGRAAHLGCAQDLVRLLADLVQQGACPVVILPELHDPNLLTVLAPLCAAIEVLPMLPRQAFHAPYAPELVQIKGLLEKYSPEAVHVTSAELHAPLLAAREIGLPRHVHMSRLPCPVPGLDRPALREALHREADYCVMPNTAAATWYAKPSVLSRIEPFIPDQSLFDLALPVPGVCPTLAVIGGLDDLEEIEHVMALSRHVAQAGIQAKFVLIGPKTPEISGLAPFGGRLQHLGLASSPAEALTQADVVLDLQMRGWGAKRSTFEAMAAARPVVCLARAGVDFDGPECGAFLVPPERLDTLARIVLALAAAPGQHRALGLAGRSWMLRRGGHEAPSQLC